MESYLNLLKEVMRDGEWKNQRAKTKDGKDLRTKSISGYMIKHDLRDGFPLITTKFVSLKNVNVELEFFIKGLTDKRWLQERNCKIWDAWKNPSGDDENDLGRVYGRQWRSYRKYIPEGHYLGGDFLCRLEHIDQLGDAIETLMTDPTSRRIIVNAWNPAELSEMAIPPCHYSYQLLSNGKELDLIWSQRACDTFLGIPYNIASYAMLLNIIAKVVNMTPRYLIGQLSDCHIYENHIEQVTEQLTRTPYSLPTVDFKYDFNSIDDWTCDNYVLNNYVHHPKIIGEVAI